MFIRPRIFERFEYVIAAESTRHGGISSHPYASLNLGLNTDDKADQVRQNRRRFLTQLGIPDDSLATAHQVHDKKVLNATKPILAKGYDAIITSKAGLAVGVTIADCCPVLIFDEAHQAVAAVHAGWRGTAKQIVCNTLERMQSAFGTRAENCFAYIGVCISQAHYEVDDLVARYFMAQHKHKGHQTGKWYVDLRMANHDQLTGFGIPSDQIEVSSNCTWTHNEQYFSHRKEKGQTGRMMAAIGYFPV